jgi:arginine N-succinyltransferase
LRTYIFPTEFDPVTLSEKDQRRLDDKLRRLGWSPPSRASGGQLGQGRLEPEAYSERDADRNVTFSEKELNALIASSPEMAQRLAIDLSDDLASAKLLISVPEDFPVMAGKILRVNAGLELAYASGRPVAILKGVSVMGVPIPNAWLGGIKNVDLVSEFGDAGFWQAFADGVEMVKVEDGELVIKLKE